MTRDKNKITVELQKQTLDAGIGVVSAAILFY